MAIVSVVAVLLVEGDGPGNQVGTGSLMSPDEVLVHRPLSERIARGDLVGAQGAPGDGPCRLRVCVASWDPAASIELIDIAQVSVHDAVAVEDLDGSVLPLVRLTLDRRSQAPGNPPQPTAEELVRFLEDPFNGPATDEIPRRPNILCRALGWFC